MVVEILGTEHEEVVMPRKQHSEEQIIGALKQYEAGHQNRGDLPQAGISQATFYSWKRQYAGPIR